MELGVVRPNSRMTRRRQATVDQGLARVRMANPAAVTNSTAFAESKPMVPSARRRSHKRELLPPVLRRAENSTAANAAPAHLGASEDIIEQHYGSSRTCSAGAQKRPDRQNLVGAAIA